MSVKFKITGTKLNKIINAIRDVKPECKLQFYPDGMRVYIMNLHNTMVMKLHIEPSSFVQYSCESLVNINVDVNTIYDMRGLIDTVMTVSVTRDKIIFGSESGTGFTIHSIKTVYSRDDHAEYSKVSNRQDDRLNVMTWIRLPKTVLSFLKASKAFGEHIVLNINKKDGVLFVSDESDTGDICICKTGYYTVISDDIKSEDVKIRNGYKIEYLMPIFKSLTRNVEIRTKQDGLIRVCGDLFDGCESSYYLAPKIIDEGK